MHANTANPPGSEITTPGGYGSESNLNSSTSTTSQYSEVTTPRDVEVVLLRPSQPVQIRHAVNSYMMWWRCNPNVSITKNSPCREVRIPGRYRSESNPPFYHLQTHGLEKLINVDFLKF